MGLEKHVDNVLKEAGLIPLLWKWENGLVVEDDVDAQIIMAELKRSGQFGPTEYNMATRKIEFGPMPDLQEPESEWPSMDLLENFVDISAEGGPGKVVVTPVAPQISKDGRKIQVWEVKIYG